MGHGIAQVAAAAGYGRPPRRRRDGRREGLRARVEPRQGRRAGQGDRRGARRALSPSAPTTELAERPARRRDRGGARAARVEARGAPRVDAWPRRASRDQHLVALDRRDRRAARRPERVVGMHFFNPVHIMRLVEIVVGPGPPPRPSRPRAPRASGSGRSRSSSATRRASPRAASASPSASRRSGWSSRASRAPRHRHRDGARLRPPDGPPALTDHVGLDVRLAIAEYLHRELGSERFRPPGAAAMVAAGKLGKKTGEGFYKWND